MKGGVEELFYPTTCIFCGKIEKSGLCPACRRRAPYIFEPRCKRCGKPVRYEEQEFCHDCQEKEHFYEQGRSVWLHREEVRQSVYQFKYKNRRIFAETYADELVRLYAGILREWRIDVLIPIPLHRRKYRRRGYNQAQLLAEALSARTGLPVETGALRRRRETKALKSLNPSERRRALAGAFAVSGDWKAKRSVLLVDDIYTTGSTIDAAAQSLRENGAQKVYFLTISIGQGF